MRSERERLLAAVRARLSEARFRHTLAVAETAARLARRHGADADKAWLAGLLHDYARELPAAEAVRLAAARGLAAGVAEPSVALLHAPLGAALAREELGVEDEEVLRAVACHTTGAPGMSKLDKVVFLADAIAPGRDYPGVEAVRALAWDDLDAAVLASLEGTVADLEGAGRRVDERARAAMAELRERVGR